MKHGFARMRQWVQQANYLVCVAIVLNRTQTNNPCFIRVSSVAFILAAAFTGCGGRTAAVNGHVKFADGSDVGVLDGYTVMFQTEGDRISASGDINKDGAFKVSTYSANDGAVPGHHLVCLARPEPLPDQPPPKPIIPAKYTDFATSGLTADIKAGQTNNVEFTLERMPK